ncbi:GNAT family N-acetyltransferase [Demequina lignilytica]|uniref:GNAT family protein n=1 Tax=Demequina lignilytica TaxID=3051663 RepID=A0AAW7M3K2_9MICO|nr:MULTISPECIES: GNAT family protein [unclassified Demequina]MDN4477552.1 GNAT family protein [Demequina sp. SYSU T00039-1]MDN4483597.1 GNAT family protein [Demequina sp. SYSU T0a273]MDN4488097.1 GNAT family protein [Demequina sp. SYSU T00039]MDN4490538.1 GNAT family protein [Demequina sp. SYSU T00068]
MGEPELVRGTLRVRPLRVRDADEWAALRSANRDWLRPWEATAPPEAPIPAVSFRQFIRSERRARRLGTGWPMAIELDGALVGRVVVAGVEWGAQRSGSLGYWLDREHAGLGIVPTAAAMLVEHAFAQGLHRVEVAMRPENQASRRVAEKLGFTLDGPRRSFLYIDGGWRDHIVYSRTQDQPRTGRYWEPEG